MGKKLSQRRESSTQRGRESPLRGAGSAAAGGARPREVWGRGLREPAARSAASSSSGFSLRHPLPLPVSPLTPPPGLRTGFLP